MRSEEFLAYENKLKLHTLTIKKNNLKPIIIIISLLSYSSILIVLILKKSSGMSFKYELREIYYVCIQRV